MGTFKNLKLFLLSYLILTSHSLKFQILTNDEMKAYEEISKFWKIIIDSINFYEFAQNKSEKYLIGSYDIYLIVFSAVKAFCALWKGLIVLFSYNPSKTFKNIKMEEGFFTIRTKNDSYSFWRY